MTFTQLSIFSALAEFKSFTETARRLEITQSAISHALKALESQWGVMLFLRNKNEVVLTEAGQTLLSYAKEILTISDSLDQKVADIKGFKTGTLRIGSFGASSSNVLLPLIMQKFSRQYPDVEFFIEEGNDSLILQWLDERRIDVGFVLLPEERFDTYPLIEDIFVALVHKDLPIAKQHVVTLDALIEYPFLMTSAGSQSKVEEMFRKANIHPNIKCHFTQILSIANMVNNNVGVSIIADMALDQQLLKHYPNVRKLPLMPNVKRAIGLAVKNKKYMTPITQAFIETALTI